MVSIAGGGCWRSAVDGSEAAPGMWWRWTKPSGYCTARFSLQIKCHSPVMAPCCFRVEDQTAVHRIVAGNTKRDYAIAETQWRLCGN